MKVLIPARANSRRVPQKNYIDFHNDESLMDIKLKQLLASYIPGDAIHVSCEDESKRACIEKHGCVFLPRNDYLTTPEGEKNLTRSLVKELGLVGTTQSEGDFLYVSVTDPFFTEFSSMLSTWNRVRDKHDSLVVVRKLDDQVLFGDGSPANFDYFGQPTQCLKSWYTVSMGAIISKWSTVNSGGHYIGKNPYLFVTRDRGVDIDTIDDFALAQVLYASRFSE